MNKLKFRSNLHVIIQFSILFYFILSADSIFVTGFLMYLEIAGIILGIWSIWVMRKSILTIFPIPAKNFQLITKGPYRIIRHPMYTALILVLLSLTLSTFTRFRLILLVIFMLNIVLKLTFEEQLLRKAEPEYEAYCKSTWRLIPILY